CVPALFRRGSRTQRFPHRPQHAQNRSSRSHDEALLRRLKTTRGRPVAPDQGTLLLPTVSRTDEVPGLVPNTRTRTSRDHKIAGRFYFSLVVIGANTVTLAASNFFVQARRDWNLALP